MRRPGGYFVFSENFLPKERESSSHQVSCSRTEIESLLLTNNFEVARRARVFCLMNRPLKSSRKLLKHVWHLVEHVTSNRERPSLGGLLGAALYPAELMCLRFMSTGPSTEMMICRLRS